MSFEKVESGHHVKIWYKGTFDDGTVFDCSDDHEEPLEFDIGKKQIIPGLENAIVGMKKDEEKRVHINSNDAYGDWEEKLVQTIDKDANMKDLKEGQMVMLRTKNNYPIQATVKKVTTDKITLDLNHPLAGKALNFEFKVLEISEGREDIASGCDCCDHADHESEDGSGNCSGCH